MELESVPVEIDEMQRRITQLELADRQLAEETEEHAAAIAAKRSGRNAKAPPQLASLREQWEAEKLGIGDVQPTRKRLDAVEHEISQLTTQIKENQSAGMPVSEELYQKLFNLDKDANRSRKVEASTTENPTIKPAMVSPVLTPNPAKAKKPPPNTDGKADTKSADGKPDQKTQSGACCATKSARRNCRSRYRLDRHPGHAHARN